MSDIKIRNEQRYWIKPDGRILRKWSKEEWSSLQPEDHIEYETYEKLCPLCGRHYYYCSHKPSNRVNICHNCSYSIVNASLIDKFFYFLNPRSKYPNKNRGYKKVKIKLNCHRIYEYYDEELCSWRFKYDFYGENQ